MLRKMTFGEAKLLAERKRTWFGLTPDPFAQDAVAARLLQSDPESQWLEYADVFGELPPDIIICTTVL